MNLEKYFRKNNLSLGEDYLMEQDIKQMINLIKRMEKGNDKNYKLILKDRGLTIKDLELFIKYVKKIDYIGRKSIWIRSWLCMMGPIAYSKVKQAIYDRLDNETKDINKFLDKEESEW